MAMRIIDIGNEVTGQSTRPRRRSLQDTQNVNLLHRCLDSIRDEIAHGTRVNKKLVRKIAAGLAHLENVPEAFNSRILLTPPPWINIQK